MSRAGQHGRRARCRAARSSIWASVTTKLLNLHNVLGLLVDLEPAADALLERICAGPLLDAVAMSAQGLFTGAPVGPSERKRKARPSATHT